jgi:intracellular sulfur oxidation DsrE/DsrF family protein
MEALDGGVSSLQEGHEVVVLFDGNSVPALRMHLKREKKTLLHDSRITGQERQALAERLKVSLTDAPSNYFEYVQYLAKAGAKVFVNRNGVKQFGLAEEEIHPIATLVTTGQISDILDQSDFCYTVGAVARH